MKEEEIGVYQELAIIAAQEEFSNYRISVMNNNVKNGLASQIETLSNGEDHLGTINFALSEPEFLVSTTNKAIFIKPEEQILKSLVANKVAKDNHFNFVNNDVNIVFKNSEKDIDYGIRENSKLEPTDFDGVVYDVYLKKGYNTDAHTLFVVKTDNASLTQKPKRPSDSIENTLEQIEQRVSIKQENKKVTPKSRPSHKPRH